MVNFIKRNERGGVMRVSARLTSSICCFIMTIAVLLSGAFMLGASKNVTFAEGDEQSTATEETEAQSNGLPIMHKVTLHVNGHLLGDIYVAHGGVLDEQELTDMITFEPGGYLSDEDVSKIRDVKWEYDTTGTVFDFDSKITKDCDVYATYGLSQSSADMTYIWVLAIGGAVIVLVFIIATLLRNRTTKMSLKNKYVMSPKLKSKVEEIKEIEKRKEQYSVLNEDD